MKNNDNNNTDNKIYLEPKIFFFSFDEVREYFLSKSKGVTPDPKEFMDILIKKINKIKPDIIVSTADRSLSCTSDHMLHHFTHLIDEMYKKDRNKNYKDYTPITNDYRLLAKADSVTKKRSSIMSCMKKKMLGDEISGIRMRIFERVDFDTKLNKNIKNKSFSGKYSNNSNYDELFTNGKQSNNSNKSCVTKVGYKRYSDPNNDSNNTILCDISIKKNNNNYRYFFIFYKSLSSTSNKIFLKPNSDLTNNFKEQNGKFKILSVPYEVKIFLIDYDSFDIKYKKYNRDEPINFLNLKNKLYGFEKVKEEIIKTCKYSCEIKYIKTHSMITTPYNPNEVSRFYAVD